MDDSQCFEIATDIGYLCCHFALKHCQEDFHDVGNNKKVAEMWRVAQKQMRSKIREYCDILASKKLPMKHDYFYVITRPFLDLQSMLADGNLDSTSIEGPIRTYMSVFERELLSRLNRNEMLLDKILKKLP